MGRYAWDEATGKLSTSPTAQQDPATGVGNFANRASNPVIQAVSDTATEAILWEVQFQLQKLSSALIEGLLHRSSLPSHVMNPCLTTTTKLLLHDP